MTNGTELNFFVLLSDIKTQFEKCYLPISYKLFQNGGYFEMFNIEYLENL